jgi:hypothetical protein
LARSPSQISPTESAEEANFDVKDLITDANIAGARFDTLYGSKVTVTLRKFGEANNLSQQEIYLYRYFDTGDDDHTDGRSDYPKAYTERNVTQNKRLVYAGPGSAQPTLQTGGGEFSVAGEMIGFNPSAQGERNDNLSVRKPGGGTVGTIGLRGSGVGQQRVLFPKSGLTAAIRQIVDQSPVPANQTTFVNLFPADSADAGTLRSDEAGFQAVVDDIYNASVVNAYVNFLNVSADALDAIVISDTAAGTGQLVTSTFVGTGANPCGNAGTPACAYWADFHKTRFINTFVAEFFKTSTQQDKFRFDSITNRSYSDNPGGNLAVIENIDVLASFNTIQTAGAGALAAFKRLLANAITHEVGHDLGATHLRSAGANYIVGDGDVMGTGGSDAAALHTFITFGPLVKYSLGLPVTDAEHTGIFNYYRTFEPLETYRHNVTLLRPGDTVDDTHVMGPVLAVFDGPLVLGGAAPNPLFDESTIDVGQTNADGPGGMSATFNVVLFNEGDEPLTINNVTLVGGTGFALENVGTLPIVLPAIDPANPNPAASTRQFTIRFDPSAPGAANTVLRVTSNSLTPEPHRTFGDLEIDVTARAISPLGDIVVSSTNNNVGGAAIGSTVQAPSLATITNAGAAALNITGIALADGAQFALIGLPVGFPATPITLAPGASVTFGVGFSPNAIGLQRDMIQIRSNDPDSPLVTQTVVGTGLPATGSALDYGRDFVALETPFVPASPVFRTRSDADGNWSFFLPPETFVHFAIFDPTSGLIANGFDTTAASGVNTSFGAPVFMASTSPDGDGDGLPDEIEFAVGTSSNRPDSDGDGLDDFTEVARGLDPLGGRSFPTGVIAAADVPGDARAVVVEDSPVPAYDLLAYVATGPRGLSVVDVTQFDAPQRIGELLLPGDSNDVAVDSARNLAVVASGMSGLHLVDISDPANPTRLTTVDIPGGAARVDIVDGIAYVAGGSVLYAVELGAGEIAASLDLHTGFNSLTDVVHDGLRLFTMDTANTLRAIDIIGLELTLLDSLALTVGANQIFVGGGVAYVASDDGFQGGFATVNVADPSNLQLISDPDDTSIAGEAIAANGSGLAVIVGHPGGAFGTNNADLVVVIDPTNTGNLRTRFTLPGTPQGVAIADGIAFVADGSGGLQIVNYLGFDAEGQPPTITITGPADIDPVQAGNQIVEGSSIPVRVMVTDDVQVARVEFLVNGRVVNTDLSFPYDFSTFAPSLASGVTTVRIQARAVDTGGNTGLSNELMYELVPDTFGPTVVSSLPAEGARRLSIRGITLQFNEPIDPASVTPAAVTLTNLGADGVVGGGDDTPVPIGTITVSGTRRITLTPAAALVTGQHQLLAGAGAVTDRVGNALTVPFTLNFFKRPPSTPILIGDVVAGEIFEVGDEEVFTFSGTVGQRIGYDGLESDFDGLTVALTSPTGQSISFTSDDTDLGPFTLIETGTYRLTVAPPQGATGDFRFRIVDQGASTALTLDTDVVGQLGPFELDAFFFDGTADQRLYFDGQGPGTCAAVSTLFSPSNGFLSSRCISDDFEVTLPGPGQYIFVQSSFGGDPIDYQFRVVTPTTTTAPLTLGSTVTGTLDEAGERDVFTFAGVPGQRVFYDALEAEFDQITAQLMAPGGSLVLFTNTDQDSQTVTLLEAGTYQLEISNSVGVTGDYIFQLVDVASLPVLSLDVAVPGTLDPSLERAAFQFAGVAGHHLYFDFQGTGDCRAQWELTGPADQFLGSACFGNDFEVTLPSNGTYVLGLTSSDPAGPYPFQFAVVTPDTTTTALTIGATTNGTITELGEIDNFTFAGAAGQRIAFDSLDAFGASISFRLESPTGVPLFQSSSGSNSGLLTLTETGTHRVVVDGSGFATGPYSFQIEDVAAATVLSLDNVTNGSLDPALDDQFFRFDGTAGQQLYFDGQGTSTCQSGWRLVSPANNDLGSACFGNDFEVTLPQDGTYVLVFASFDPAGPHPFQFSVVTPTTTTSALTLGTTVMSNITEAGERDVYTFAGTVGQRVLYDAVDGDFDSIIAQLVSPAGATLLFINVDSDSAILTLTETGTYRLEIDGSGDATGDYRFRVLDLGTATLVTLGVNLMGQLSHQLEANLFSISGTAGQRLDLDSIAADSTNANWSLIGTANQVLSSANIQSNHGSDVLLPAAGTYALLISGGADNAATLDYTVRVSDVSDAPVAPSGFGTVQIGTIVGGQEDQFNFTAPAGLLVYFDSQDFDFDALTATLLDPASSAVFTTNASFDSGPHVLPRSGSYTLNLRGTQAGDTGDYSVRLLDLTNDAIALALDTTTMGSLDPGHERDVYRFNGVAGQRLFYDALDADFDNVSVVLLSPTGAILYSSNADFDSAILTLSETGPHYLYFGFDQPAMTDYQFRLVDVAGLPALPLDTPTSAQLNPALQTVAYRLAGMAGQALFLDFTSMADCSASWNLIGPLNNTLAGSCPGFGFDGALALPTDGTYVLAFNGQNPASMPSFDFNMVTPSTTTTAYTLDTTVTGTIGEPGEVDVYTFAGAARQRVFYDGLQNDFANINVQINTPSGAFFTVLNTDSDSSIMTLNETGTYQLRLSGSGDVTGDYSFQLQDITGFPLLALDTPVTGTLDPSLDGTGYRFAGTAGQRLYIDFQGMVDCRVFSNLTGPNNQGLGGSCFGADFEATLPLDGTYTLGLSSSDPSATYPFDFTVVTPDTTTTAYTLGSTVTGTLVEKGELDVFTFNGTPGQRLYYDALDADFDGINAVLVSPSEGILLSTNSDFDSSFVRLTEAGVYRLQLGGGGVTGDYSFQLVDAASLPVAGLDTLVTGSLDPGLDGLAYQFVGTAGQRLYIDFQGAVTCQAFWSLNPPDNAFGTGNCLGADGELTLSRDGTYIITLGSTDPAGPYPFSFTIRTPATTTTVYTLGTTVNGMIAEPGAQDVYTFTGAVGQRLIVDNVDTDFDQVQGQITSPTGQFVAFFSSSLDSQPVVLIEAGTYRLTVSEAGGALDDYSFRVLDLAAATPLVLNATTVGVLSPFTETDVFRFDGVAGQQLQFVGPGGGSCTALLTLIGPAGQRIESSCLGFDFQAALPGPGPYALLVQAFGATMDVPYQFDVLSTTLLLDPAARLAAPGGTGTAPVELTQAALDALVAAAAERWAAASADSGLLDELLTQGLFQVADLPDSYLGVVAGDTIWLDDDAAGQGWFIDPTPQDDAEFTAGDGPTQSASAASTADARVDLLTVIMHELGHRLGLGHGESSLMDDTLAAGIRRVPSAADVDMLLAQTAN